MTQIYKLAHLLLCWYFVASFVDWLVGVLLKENENHDYSYKYHQVEMQGIVSVVIIFLKDTAQFPAFKTHLSSSIHIVTDI